MQNMVGHDAETSNRLFEVLLEWNTFLEHGKAGDDPEPPSCQP